MNLYAFDVDGTLETSNGPVTILRLKQLQSLGHAVVIVSPSELAPADFEKCLPGDRTANLVEAATRYPQAKRKVYVSDNNDQASAEATGFEYIPHDRF